MTGENTADAAHTRASGADGHELDPAEWARILDGLEPATFGEVASAVEDVTEVADGPAAVEAALEAGILVEDPDAGAFGGLRLADAHAPESGVCDGDGDAKGKEDGEDSDALDAFADAVAFMHDRIDGPMGLGDGRTAREYLREERGWSDETINAAGVGWAPPGDTTLLQHLMRQGYDREAILGTGLFYGDGEVRPHFRGRLVFPYFGRDGEPVYAIARTVNHPEDHIDAGQKYVKAVKTKDYSAVDEPIYGLGSLEAHDGPILITEGIADAITAHAGGWRCLSPVTVQFKDRHLAPLADELREYDAPVYVVQDAEPAPSSVEDDAGGWDALHLQQFADGLKGGVKTAGYLAEEGVDAEVAELPLPARSTDFHKVDLDDYLQEWGDLAPVLASAKPAADHPAYDPDDATTAKRTDDRDSAVEQAASNAPDGSGSSALFDLDVTDVAGVGETYRGKNPLGHHGDSENYFVVVSDSVAYDHKHKAAYNALTYLLVEGDVRNADEPGGRVDDTELFAAWLQAKQGGHIPNDDPVPFRALVGVAVDDGLLNVDDLVERESDGGEGTYTGFPDAETYNAALEHVREEYDVEPGREPATAGREDAEPEPALPLARLDTLDRDEARRFAKRNGVEWPTTREAREELRKKLHQAMRHGDTLVLDAPTALGKSYAVATERWLDRPEITRESPVVMLSETREARDQAAQKSSDAGVEYHRLLGRTEACPVAAGEFDPADDDEEAPEVVVTMGGVPASAWFEAVCEGRGLPFSVAHQYLDEHNDRGVDLPCCAAEGERCKSIAQWDDVPRGEDGSPSKDVIHATHEFAHVPSLRNGTNLVFDERPQFRTDLGHGRVREAVAAFLKDAGAPVTDFERFVARALGGEPRPNEHAECPYVSDALDHDPDREWYLEADGAHTLAPALAKAIWYALRGEDDEGDASDANGRYAATVPHEPPRLDADANDDSGWNREWVRVVLDEDNTVRHVRAVPDTSAARSVVGLDAHPTTELWQQNVHPDILAKPVLSPTKRRLWRRFERGLTVVQVGDATRPLTSGEYFDHDGTEAFLRALRDRYGDRFGTAITAASVEGETERLLEEVGVDDPETMHYGEEKSRGDFGDEDVGALNGCIDPGDGYVLDLLAEADLDARPETVEDGDGEVHRARGRGFVGPDASHAEALLASVREQHVAQAAGRYARNADDPEDTAVVFVRTDATPTGFVDLQVPGVEWLPTERQREIVAELRDRPTATARELADATGHTKEHVRKTLKRLVDEEVVRCREEAGDHAAHVYRAVGGLGEGEVVDIETTNASVWDTYTWSLAVYAPPAAQVGSVAAARADAGRRETEIAAADTADPPD